MTDRPTWQYLKGYREAARCVEGDNAHVVRDGIDRMMSGRWHLPSRDDGAYWRGYAAGFIAICVGVDLSGGLA